MIQDLRFALRQLVNARGVSFVTILTLALAIGCNTALFSAIDTVLLHPLSYPEPDQLVMVRESLPRYSLHGLAPSAADYSEFLRQVTCFSHISAVTGADATLTGDNQPEEVPALRITASAFPMLGVVPILGGLFSDDAEQTGRDHVVILSEGLWKRRYGGDQLIVGRNIQINRESYRVAGVIRPILDYRVTADLWMPLVFDSSEAAPGSRSPHEIDVIGRLRPGTTIHQARDEFRRIASRMFDQYPNQVSMDPGFSIELELLAQEQAGDLGTPLLLLAAAVAVLMLIVCATVSDLLLAQGVTRRREIGVRLAIGATRGRIVRQLLTESLLLAALAGGAGTLMAMYGLHLFAQLGPAGLIHGALPHINARVLSFSLCVSATASVIFGLAPALDTSRIGPIGMIKEASIGSTPIKRLLRESIVAFEVCASIVLLIGGGLLVRSFVRLERTNPGFLPERVLTASLSLPSAQYPEAAQRAAFARLVLERVRAIPGVQSAASVDFLPYRGGPGSGGVQIAGRARNPNEPRQVIWQTRASPDFFKTLGIPLLRGRDMTASDERSTLGAAVIDETVARTLFPNVDPIGMNITVPLTGGTFTVVGTVAATKSGSLSAAPKPRVYYFGPQVPFSSLTIVMKTASNPLALAAAVRREVSAVDAYVPVDVMTLDQVLAASLARQRFSAQLSTIFAAFAGLLSVIGIYSLLTFMVDQRRREFGIRMALGATSPNVLALVLRHGLIPVLVGLIAGIGGAVGLTRLLKGLLYEVSTTDPLTFGVVAIGVAAASLTAMLIPARRATGVDPAEALRQW